MERILERNEIAYKNMVAVAKMLEALSPNFAKYEVEDTYLDFGQDWKWTTIVRYGYMECQVLDPREWENIFWAETLEQLTNCVNEIRNGKFFMDR